MNSNFSEVMKLNNCKILGSAHLDGIGDWSAFATCPVFSQYEGFDSFQTQFMILHLSNDILAMEMVDVSRKTNPEEMLNMLF